MAPTTGYDETTAKLSEEIAVILENVNKRLVSWGIESLFKSSKLSFWARRILKGARLSIFKIRISVVFVEYLTLRWFR